MPRAKDIFPADTIREIKDLDRVGGFKRSPFAKLNYGGSSIENYIEILREKSFYMTTSRAYGLAKKIRAMHKRNKNLK